MKMHKIHVGAVAVALLFSVTSLNAMVNVSQVKASRIDKSLPHFQMRWGSTLRIGITVIDNWTKITVHTNSYYLTRADDGHLSLWVYGSEQDRGDFGYDIGPYSLDLLGPRLHLARAENTVKPGSQMPGNYFGEKYIQGWLGYRIPAITTTYQLDFIAFANGSQSQFKRPDLVAVLKVDAARMSVARVSFTPMLAPWPRTSNSGGCVPTEGDGDNDDNGGVAASWDNDGCP